jgi:hypothetical protein
VHRALVGNLHQPLALIGVERALDRDHAVDLVQHALPRFAFLAVYCVNLAVLQRHGDAIERQRLAVGIHSHRHGGAGAKACKHEIIRAGSAILAADGNGFVRQHLVRTRGDDLLELAVARFAHHDVARPLARGSGGLRCDGLDIAFGPGGDNAGDIGSIALAG